jgi:hypothetical protein
MTNSREPVDQSAGSKQPHPEKKPARQPEPDRSRGSHRKYYPPDSIPNPMPGLDPQQTPGIDRFPENED